MQKTFCASGETIKGIDIYHGDCISDINKVLSSGIQFIILKAWEYSADPSFLSRWAALAKHSVIRGAYDFFHPETDPLRQAQKFINLVGPLQDGDLPCILDWERASGESTEVDKDRAIVWLNFVERATGKVPIIYGGNVIKEENLDSRFVKYPLWVAEYGITCPKVGEPWASADIPWKFWQGSESGNVPGMRGHCDLDVFNGSRADLVSFIAASKI